MKFHTNCTYKKLTNVNGIILCNYDTGTRCKMDNLMIRHKRYLSEQLYT